MHGRPLDEELVLVFQVIADLRTDRGDACEVHDVALVASASAGHQDRAGAWLERRRAGDTVPQRPKKHRRKSYEWCATLDNALRGATGRGLQDLQVKKAELANPTAPQSWRLAGGVADKGSDGCCASAFLTRQLHLNLDRIWDPSHGAWGSCKEAIQKCGLGVHQFLMLMAYNVNYGEWKDGCRYEQIQGCHEAHDRDGDGRVLGQVARG